MLSIVGNKIYMNEGDDCSFKVMYKDSDGIIHNFYPDDILTIHIRDRETKETILSRDSESFLIDNVASAILTFRSSDVKKLCAGNYKYDLIVDTAIGYQYIVVDNADLHIVKSTYDNTLKTGFSVHRTETLGSSKISLSTSSLVCNLDYRQYPKEEAEGTLITFNPKITTEDRREDDEEGTLILYGDLGKSSEQDSTLILFGGN